MGNTAVIQLSFVLRGMYQLLFQGTWKIAEMINLADLDRFLVRTPAGGIAAFDCQD